MENNYWNISEAAKRIHPAELTLELKAYKFDKDDYVEDFNEFIEDCKKKASKGISLTLEDQHRIYLCNKIIESGGDYSMKIYHVDRDYSKSLEKQKKELKEQYKGFNYLYADPANGNPKIHFMAEGENDDKK